MQARFLRGEGETYHGKKKKKRVLRIINWIKKWYSTNCFPKNDSKELYTEEDEYFVEYL